MDISEKCILLNTYPIHIHGPLLHLITAFKTGIGRLPLEVLKRWENFTEALRKLFFKRKFELRFFGEKSFKESKKKSGVQCVIFAWSMLFIIASYEHRYAMHTSGESAVPYILCPLCHLYTTEWCRVVNGTWSDHGWLLWQVSLLLCVKQ